MIDLKNAYRNNKWYFLFGFVGLSLLYIIGLINSKLGGVDFEVYYYAAKAFIIGEEVYGGAFGNSEVGFYKYSPFVLFLYIPAGMLPFKVALTINYFALTLIALLAIYFAGYLVVKVFYDHTHTIRNKLLFFVLLLSVTFLNRDLLIGNVNTIMLLFVCLGLFFSMREKPFVSGLFYALLVVFKPYLLIFALPLFGNTKLKTCMSTLILVVLLSLLPFVFTGWSIGYQLYMDWFSSMMEHSNYIISPFTFDSLIKQYLLLNSSFNFSIFFTAFVGSFYLIFKLVNHIKGISFPSYVSSKQLLVMETFTLLALVPNLVNTDTQQLMYAIPLIAFLIQYLLLNPNRYLLVVYIIIFFFFSIDQPDILGKTLSIKFYQMGISGISNLLIICMSWIIFVLQAKNSPDLKENDSITNTGPK